MSALHLAGYDADVGAVSALLAGDANCLMLAAQSGNAGVVAALVEHGAAVDARVDGITALMVAARQGHAAVVEALLRFGADPAIRCGRYAASDHARHCGHDGLADLLAAASSRPTRDGVTP